MTQAQRLLQALKRGPMTKVQILNQLGVPVSVKQVPGFSHYFAGDDGRIYSDYKKDVVALVGGVDKDGYAKHVLCEDGGRHYVRAHVAVAMAWIGPVPDGFVVAHKDGDLSNNAPSNLKICTQKENVADKKTHGTQVFGELHPRARITNLDAAAIFAEHKNESVANLAEKYGISKNTVYCIITKRTWRHLHGEGANK